MPQYVPIYGPFGHRGSPPDVSGRFSPVPLSPGLGGAYVGEGVTISPGPSSSGFVPVPSYGHPARPGPAPAAGPPRPPDRGPVGLPPSLHPGVRFFTFKQQVLQTMQVGQTLHFQPGRGYFAWPPVTPNPVHGTPPQ